MIYIKIDNDTFYDDAIVLVRSFYPRMEVKAYKQDTVATEADKVIDITVPDMTGLNKSEMHDKFKSYLYDRLSQMTGKTLPWGYLTGVRPSKIAYVMLEDGEDEQTIKKHFMDKHKASEKKASLAKNVAKKEMDILNKIDYKNGYSLYIGIPFCPSICLYCSFSSYALDAYKNYVDDYLDALIKEMTFVARAMKGRRLDTVYFGGGTPTTLGAAQLDRLITALKELFDIDGCHEFTVEAGRPDSITRDKLKVLKAHNVGRISINPQTMNQQTLDLIGRKHTVEQIKNVYSMAREEGFNNINMDIITGLKKLGPRIALDDFGTGYSSLNYIKQLPLDIIKVDKTFIDDIVEDDYAQAFIKLIVDLSKTIGTKIVVEGVEHKEQFELLKSLGVDYIQGYYFGKPVPANIFEEKNLEGRLGE